MPFPEFSSAGNDVIPSCPCILSWTAIGACFGHLRSKCQCCLPASSHMSSHPYEQPPLTVVEMPVCVLGNHCPHCGKCLHTIMVGRWCCTLFAVFPTAPAWLQPLPHYHRGAGKQVAQVLWHVGSAGLLQHVHQPWPSEWEGGAGGRGRWAGSTGYPLTTAGPWLASWAHPLFQSPWWRGTLPPRHHSPRGGVSWVLGAGRGHAPHRQAHTDTHVREGLMQWDITYVLRNNNIRRLIDGLKIK